MANKVSKRKSAIQTFFSNSLTQVKRESLVAKREIKTALDKLQKSKLEKKRREALADQHYIFVILNERELLSAA